MSNTKLKIHEHLFQIYPSMPKYAADPSESLIIKTYDHLMLRFAGHYGRQPEYFIKSPLCPVLFGDPHQYVNLPTVAFNSSQSIIIAISKTSSKKIRLNHYETTLFGELQLPTSVSEWKFNTINFQENEQAFNMNGERIKNEQQNLVMKILKVFAQINNLMELTGFDVLVYKDFTEEKFLYSKEALIYGLYTAVHTCLLRKVHLEQKTLHKAFQKIFDSSEIHVEGLPQLIHASYNTLACIESFGQKPKTVQFPKGYSLIIANTMTPQPKKLVKGKRFNLRECEIQIGIELILSDLGIIKEVRSIKQLLNTIQCNTKELLDTIDSTIPTKPMNVEQIENILQRPLPQVLKHILSASNVIEENVEFNPYKQSSLQNSRMKFFLEELSIIEALTNPNSTDTFQNLLKVSSNNASSLLQITSEQIEDINKISAEFNAVTKVLGNGWGGCMAILCKKELAQKLEQQLIERFYLAQKNRVLLGDDIQVYIKLVGEPQVGLAILDPTNEIWFG